MTATIAPPTVTPEQHPPTVTAGSMIHRDQHQIRAHFLNSLGIVRTPIVTTATAVAMVEDDDMVDAEQQHQQQHPYYPEHELPLHYQAADDAPPRKTTRISFGASVSVRTIPSHREYDAATRMQLWNGTAAVAEMVQRNTREYTAEGWSLEGVLEEDQFVTVSSSTGNHPPLLLHPMTHQYQQDEVQRQKLLKKKNKKAKSYAYKSVAQCLSFAPPPSQRSSPRKNRRRTKTGTTAGTKVSTRRSSTTSRVTGVACQ